MDEQSKPPNVLINERLLGLIRNSESDGNESDSFNPWAMAFHNARMGAMPIHGLSYEDAAPISAAWARQDKLFDEAEQAWTGPLVHRPFFQVAAASFCLNVKARIEAGDGFAVMEAIAQCAAHGLVLPSWLSVAFIERYQRVLSGECKGWGEPEAFGSVVPKGKNLAGVVAISKFGPWAYEVAVELLSTDPHRPIDVGLYEEVGEKIGRKATQAQSLIREYCKHCPFPPLKYIRDGLLKGMPLTAVCSTWQYQKDEKILRLHKEQP